MIGKIHLRDPNTSLIQYKTLCGLYIALMSILDKWTQDKNEVTCSDCKTK